MLAWLNLWGILTLTEAISSHTRPSSAVIPHRPCRVCPHLNKPQSCAAEIGRDPFGISMTGRHTVKGNNSRRRHRMMHHASLQDAIGRVLPPGAAAARSKQASASRADLQLHHSSSPSLSNLWSVARVGKAETTGRYWGENAKFLISRRKRIHERGRPLVKLDRLARRQPPWCGLISTRGH